MPTDTRGRIAAAKDNALESLLACELSNFEIPTSHFSAATHPRRSCFAFAGWDSLIARSDRPRLRYGDDLVTALRLGGCLRWKERLLCPLSCRLRSDWRPAIPALQSAASVTAVFSSYVAHSQRSRWRFAAGNLRN